MTIEQLREHISVCDINNCPNLGDCELVCSKTAQVWTEGQIIRICWPHYLELFPHLRESYPVIPGVI